MLLLTFTAHNFTQENFNSTLVVPEARLTGGTVVVVQRSDREGLQKEIMTSSIKYVTHMTQ